MNKGGEDFFATLILWVLTPKLSFRAKPRNRKVLAAFHLRAARLRRFSAGDPYFRTLAALMRSPRLIASTTPIPSVTFPTTAYEL